MTGVVIGAYVICSITASVTGILFAAFSGASFLGMGDQFVLPSIAAVVLGGTSMFGGRGGYGGTMAAVFFTTILTTVLVIGRHLGWRAQHHLRRCRAGGDHRAASADARR